jgi:glycosyltransferase involved in cell wall biosynthesis
MAGAASVATMLTDVVLPCLNEAAALPWVLSRMPSGYRPIVADNGSDDGSAEIVERYGALVVTVPLRGFGAACHGGLMAATSDVVCFMDADGSLDPADLPLVAGPVLTGATDLVLGRRRPEGAGAWPLHARLGNRVIAAAVRRRTGIRLRDLGPMRAARRADLVLLGLRDRRFGYPLEMVVRAAESGWRISERDIPYRPRTGRSKVTGTVGGTLRTARDMGTVLAGVTVSPPGGRRPRPGGNRS